MRRRYSKRHNLSSMDVNSAARCTSEVEPIPSMMGALLGPVVCSTEDAHTYSLSLSFGSFFLCGLAAAQLFSDMPLECYRKREPLLAYLARGRFAFVLRGYFTDCAFAANSTAQYSWCVWMLHHYAK